MTRTFVLACLLPVAACGGTEEVCDADGAMCSKLSSWGLFEDIAAQRPAPGVVPYALPTPLFSDYTTKARFVRVPDGTTATWTDDGALDLPVGSVLVKTFSYLADRRVPAGDRRLLETRLLLRGSAGWHGASYVYDDGEADAELAIAGGLLDAQWIHDDGTARTNQNYAVPNKNQCKNCHAEHDDVVGPLGPKTRHVAHDDLQQLVDTGVLVGAPPRDQWPRAVDALDPASGSLDDRARAWLDINCGFCHNPRGVARTSGLYLDRAETDPAKLGVCKAPVASGPGSGGLQYDIVPGQPDQSILVYRMEATEPAIRMPELGRNLVDAEGVALIREWIAAMPGPCSGWTGRHGQALSHLTTR